MAQPVVVFFDLGDTLGVPRFSAAGSLQRFDVFPFALDVLKRLRGSTPPAAAKRRLGVISNTGTETAENLRAVLQAAGLSKLLDPALLLFSSIEGIDKSSPELFARAAQRAGLAAQRCVFVGESEKERNVAASAGLAVSFHPLHAFHVVAGLEAGP